MSVNDESAAGGKGTQRRHRRNTGAMTLRQVAQLADVAPVTVSRVLNTPDVVSPEVRERVLAVIRETGYVPNRLAGGLASTRSNLIAAIVPTITMSVFLQTVQSLTDTLFDADYQLMLGQTGYSPEREDALLEAIIGRRPDGIVLTGVDHSAQSRQRLLGAGIPVVETWDLTDHPIDMLVGFSHRDIGSSVARYLAGRGRQQLALVTADDERARRRASAFEATALELGLPPVQRISVGGSRTLSSGRTALARLAESGSRPDAVFCSSDLLALGVMTEAQSRELRVGQDLGVVGFGDFDFVADLEPALTSVRINGAAIGEQAARFLVARAEGHAVAQPVVDVGFSIVERASA
ncbi:LacI family DNA-binding transcriptional regulator [Hydrogenophaga palleronii]|uniref:LacI family DNA-binding transcriptional regulator n=1 Tax=Hydrogenophaga palleronii TaxID=65655 RepID=UPI00286A0417|nr:LacI family DNA-binding transcriptional regulator [Hydrogenophaga palleronii]